MITLGAQQTAIQLAEERRAEALRRLRAAQWTADGIARLLHSQRDVQQQRLPPFLLAALDPYLVPDLASLIVSYVFDASSPSSMS